MSGYVSAVLDVDGWEGGCVCVLVRVRVRVRV
jgi:hypothetical protein